MVVYLKAINNISAANSHCAYYILQYVSIIISNQIFQNYFILFMNKNRDFMLVERLKGF